MNSKKDKIEFLKEVRAGHVKIEDLPGNPIVVSDPQHVWAAILTAIAQEEVGEPNSIIFVGEAKYMLQKLESEFTRLAEEYRAKDEGIAH